MSLRDVVPAQSERFACDHELFTSLATTGDAAAREELVKRFLPLPCNSPSATRTPANRRTI